MQPTIRRIKRNLISSNKWVQHYFDDVIFPNSDLGKYNDIVENNGQPGCVVIALNNRNEVCLIETFRYPLQEYSLELPRGFSDKAGDGIEQARIELLEETGYEAERISLIGKLYPNSGISSSYIFVYLAEGLTFTEHNPEASEVIKSVYFSSIADLKDRIARNIMCDSISLAACLMFFVRQEQSS